MMMVPAPPRVEACSAQLLKSWCISTAAAACSAWLGISFLSCLLLRTLDSSVWVVILMKAAMFTLLIVTRVRHETIVRCCDADWTDEAAPDQ